MPSDYFTANNNENLFHYNYSLVANDQHNPQSGFTGIQYTDAQSADNFFSDHFSPGNAPKHKMPLSQDKYHSMLIAMMFIDKYIPSSITYNGEAFQDGETSIRQEAREISKRVYNYCKGVNNSWKLRYLDSQGNSQGNLANTVGGDAWIYSFALSRMTCHVNSDFPWSTYYVTGCSNYTDPNAQTFGYLEYSLQSGSPGVSTDAAVFKTWDAAGANTAAQIGGQPIPVPAYVFMQNNTGLWSLEWSELLRKVLHQNGALLRQLSIYGEPINQAPCQGPYNYGNCNHGGWEWSAQDRLEHPDYRGASCYSTKGAFQGNYPGVDYMLLHNLYYEYQNQQLIDGNNNIPGMGGGSNGGISGIGGVFGDIISGIIGSVSGAINTVYSQICSFASNNNINTLGLCDYSVNGLTPYFAYNLMDNRDENIWPRKIGLPGALSNTPYDIQGTTFPGQEAKVAVFQNLSSIAHIYASTSPAANTNYIPSDVTYRAGKEISLEPGFMVDAGSTFRAYVQRYVCTGNNDPLTMRHLADTALSTNIYEMDYEMDRINPIPIHYYESPKSDSDQNPIVSEESYNAEREKYQIMNVKSAADNGAITIYPNPTDKYLEIRMTDEDFYDLTSIEIIDNLGRNYNIDKSNSIDVSFLSAGFYQIKFKFNHGSIIIKNFVKK